MDRFRQSKLSQGPQIEREIYTFTKVNNQVGMYSARLFTTDGQEIRARFVNLVTEFREAQAQEFQDIAETSLEEGECGLFRVDRPAGLMTFLRESTNPKRNCWVSVGDEPDEEFEL